MKVVYGKIDEIHVGSWCTSPTPTVPPTQVHVSIKIDHDVTVVLRFKGPATLDKVITALQDHRIDVFGPYVKH